jgi:hypothetical protein
MSEIDLFFASASLIVGGLVAFSVGYLKLRERVASVEVCVKDQTDNACKLKISVDELTDKISSLNDRITSQEVKTSLWWDSVKTTMIDILHHPNNPKRDILLEKMKDKTISVAELKVLKDMLKVDSLDKEHIKGDERAAAGMLYAVAVSLLYDCTKKGVSTLSDC